MKLCEYCGNELFDEAVFCPKCQKMQAVTVFVCFAEPDAYAFTPIKIDLDGAYAGELTVQNNVSLKVPTGSHTFTFYKKEHKGCRTVTVGNLNRNVVFKVWFDTMSGKIEVFEG